MQKSENYFRASLLHPLKNDGRDSKKVTIKEDKDGIWLVNKNYESLLGNTIAGIVDPYRNRKLTSAEEGEKSSMVIYGSYKGRLTEPVAILSMDQINHRASFEEFYNGILAFNVSKSLYELDDDGFVSFLAMKGELNRLYSVDGNLGVQIQGPVRRVLKSLRDNVNAIDDLPDLLKQATFFDNPNYYSESRAYHLMLMLHDMLVNEPELTIES